MFRTLGAAVYRRRWWVIGLWALIAVAGVAAGGPLNDRVTAEFTGSDRIEAARVQERIGETAPTGGDIAIVIDGSIPVWFAVAVLFREVAVGAMMAIATLLFGMERFDVNWWGKTATFLLMAAVPSFLISEAGVSESDFFGAVAWVTGIPGLALSYWTGIAYIPQVRAGIAAGRQHRADRVPSGQ